MLDLGDRTGLGHGLGTDIGRLAGRDELGLRRLLGELLLEERAFDPGQRPLRHLDRRDGRRSVDRRRLDGLGSRLGRLSLLAGFGLQLLTGAGRSRQGVEQVLIAGRRDRQPAAVRGDEDGRRGRREAHDVDRLFAAKHGPANGPAEGAASNAQPGCVRSPQPDAGHRARAQHIRPAAADPAHLDRGLTDVEPDAEQRDHQRQPERAQQSPDCDEREADRRRHHDQSPGDRGTREHEDQERDGQQPRERAGELDARDRRPPGHAFSVTRYSR